MLPTTESTVGIGCLPKGKKPQFNTLDVAGARVRYAGGEMNQEDAEKVILAAHLQGLFDAQDAVATTGVVYDQAHKDTLHVFTANKVKQATFEKLSKLFPDTNKYALVNKGGCTPVHLIDVIRIDGQPIDATDQATIQSYSTGNCASRERGCQVDITLPPMPLAPTMRCRGYGQPGRDEFWRRTTPAYPRPRRRALIVLKSQMAATGSFGMRRRLGRRIR